MVYKTQYRVFGYKKALTTVISLWFALNLCAQQVKVVDAIDNLPIEGVAIYNLSKSKYVITDLNGLADVTIFDADEDLLFQNFLFIKRTLKKSELAALRYVVVLEENIEDLNQVVISASKFSQEKTDVVQKIVTLDAADIVVANPQTSADLLENSGNVFIQKSQLGGGSPMIRGFSTNRLLITVDGVRMNNAIFRGGNIQNVISIDPFSIRETEITLGAGSVVYGSDAIGGVMSFYTNKPQLSYKDELYFKSNAVARYSSANNELTGHLDLNFGLKKWAFYTSVSYSKFDDLRMGVFGPEDYLRNQYVIRQDDIDVVVDNPNPRIQVPTGYDQINLMQKAHYEPSDNLFFDFGLYYTSTSDVPRYDRLLRTDEDGQFVSAEWDYGPQQWFMANAQLTKTSSTSNLYDQLKATFAYQNFEESRKNRDFQSDIRTLRSENVDALSFNLDLEKRLSTRTNLYYGLEYVYNMVGSKANTLNINSGESSTTVTRYPNGSTWQSVAAYTSVKFKPNPKFIFQSGLRYNHVISRASFVENNQFLNLPFDEANLNTGALTGSAGISWLPSDIVQWKFNLSTAFRAPNIDDKGKVFDSEPGAVVVPNKDLRSEYAYGADLGLKLNFSNKVIIDLGTYYTFLDNAMVRRDFTLNGEEFIIYDGELSRVQAIQNASQAWLYGFEIGALVNFTEHLSLLTQYNIVDGREKDADGTEVPVRHVSPNFGRTHIKWANDSFELDFFAVYNAEITFENLAPSERAKPFIYAKDANGNPYSPSWYTLNFRSSYQLADQWRLIASVENLTNQLYRPYSSGIAGPGTNVILSLRYSI
ncbi:TonB-dependent receptor plug domain-containing protein [Winogradskyella aurantiaca]|uniref:TonB-dependent receptor plug domain-containing protein n=1 Tax=Winogradskyella aurantiaca TaxID=2219558 RepID=UPI000E1E0562|nr:TonB-dependent receptor [Winogradskyella aurantiaca]